MEQDHDPLVAVMPLPPGSKIVTNRSAIARKLPWSSRGRACEKEAVQQVKLPVLLGSTQNTCHLPSKISHESACVSHARIEESRSTVNADGVESLLSLSPSLLIPVDLARLAIVSVALRSTVIEACAHLLRRIHWLLLPHGSLSNGERALNRAVRLGQTACSHCVAAENYSTAIDSQGRLLIWGRPGWLELRGQSSSSDDLENMDWPPLLPTVAVLYSDSSADACDKGEPSQKPPKVELIQSPTKVVSIAASRHAVFALTEDGELFFTQVRRNADYSIGEIQLLPLAELKGVRIAQIVTRFGQAFAVTTDGTVYAWGMKSGDPNQPIHSCSMGFGALCTIVHPQPIPCFGPGAGCTPIRFVAVGVSHTLFVSVFGEAYSVGRNDSSKLGLGSAMLDVEHVLVPQKVHFPSRPSPTIVMVAAGAKHSLFLSNSGQVWGCGQAQLGTLPTSQDPGPEFVMPSPCRLDRITSFITSIAAGISLSFFVTECGEVCFTGQARQTCHPFRRPSDHDISVPWKIPGARQIVQVSVSMELSFFQWEHVLFFRQDGSLCGWGHMAHGEFPAVCRRMTSRRCCQPGCPCEVMRHPPSRSGFCNSALPIPMAN
mmetsp:Transcript_43223/g.68371  ORF Transcript_43223/g.68371 Transcript_43223/m.68371 type:complete len:602 (-) Transcript_43223:131-1936(-)